MKRLLPLFALVACSPANPTPNIEPPQLASVDAGPPGPRFPSPSRWTLFENPTWTPSASIKVAEGTLQVGRGGERWLVKASGDREAASTLAPEPLEGATSDKSGYRFVGASGATYEAPTPLAPMTRASDGVKDAIAVALGSKAVLAIDAAGDLHRSIDAKGFRKVDVPGRDGMFREIAMLGSLGLLLAAPQRLYFTKDDGQTWRPIAPPGKGVKGVNATDTGLELEGDSEKLAFDPTSESFSARPPGPRTAPRIRRQTAFAAMDGKMGIVVEENSDNHEYRIAVLEAGSAPTYRKIDALDGCFHVTPAIRGRMMMLACDAVGSVDSGIDKSAAASGQLYSALRQHPPVARDGGHATGMITKLFRSDDGGKTFVDETTFDGGMTENNEAAFFLGDNGFAFLGTRCVPYGARACAPARVRTNLQAAWTELAEAGDVPRHLVFATRSGQPTYSIGVLSPSAGLYKWTAGSTTPELVASLTTSVPGGSTLDVDDSGVVRGFLRADGKPRAFEVHGNKVTDLVLPKGITTAAFGGTFGLANESSLGWETVDGAKTWHRVGLPLGSPSVLGCTEEGCLTARGMRAGWDGSGPPVVDTKPEPKWAKGLKCKATGNWVAMGGGDLPNAENIDQGQMRWLHPTRDLPGAVTLATNKWSDPPATIAKLNLAGAAPQPPTYGASTSIHVQPNGVVVLRYSYLRQRSSPGVYNPVDVNAVWYRPQTGKVFRATIAKTPSFRVNKDPHYDFTPTTSLGQAPEILWLGSKGLSFRSQAYPENDEWLLYHLRDDGKIEKQKTLEMRGDEARVLDIGSQAIVSNDGGQWIVYTVADQKENVLGVMSGQDDTDAPVSIIDIGGKPNFLATQRGIVSRTWAIPVAAKPDLAPAVAMPTQLTLGEKGCTDAASGNTWRAVLPWVYGARRPVSIDVDGTKHVLLTGRATARGVVGGEACTAGWEASDPNFEEAEDAEELGALVFPGDPNASLVFRLKHKDWPGTLQMRSMSCAFEQGALPEELKDAEGITP